MFELIVVECQKDPDPVFKDMIFLIRIRPKMDRIRTLIRLAGESENPLLMPGESAILFSG